MVKEVHEISETLVKIRAGSLTDKEFDGIHFNDSIFHNTRSNGNYNYSDEMYGDEYDDAYGDEDDYGIENHRYIQKNLSKKASEKKVTKKQLSSVITA
jgi:hypothetical protein